jgi:ketosteroid isomerase-like protein
MVDVTEISAIVAAAGVLVGVVYYVLEIRHQNRMKQTDLIMRVYSALSTKELEEAWYKVLNLECKDYNDFVKKYGDIMSETPANVAFSIIAYFFEGIGVLLHKKLVDIDLIEDLMSEQIVVTWEKMKPIVEGYRKQYGFKKDLQWFENLYNEVKKREQTGVRNG